MKKIMMITLISLSTLAGTGGGGGGIVDPEIGSKQIEKLQNETEYHTTDTINNERIRDVLVYMTESINLSTESVETRVVVEYEALMQNLSEFIESDDPSITEEERRDAKSALFHLYVKSLKK